MKPALIVVDMQNDFLPGGALAVQGGDSVIPFIVRLIENAGIYELVVVTQDWHPPGHGSFASSHPGGQPFQMGELNGLPQRLWPDHCIQDTPGARLASEIEEAMAATGIRQKTLAIRKGQDPQVDSYSAFFDNAQLHETGLRRGLDESGVQEIDIVGLTFDYCVRYTALDGIKLGYRVRVLTQGTRAVEPEDQSSIETELARAGVVCIEDVT